MPAVLEPVGDVDGLEVTAVAARDVERAREFAETGVDYLSVGALTHSSPILDIALDLRPRS